MQARNSSCTNDSASSRDSQCLDGVDLNAIALQNRGNVLYGGQQIQSRDYNTDDDANNNIRCGNEITNATGDIIINTNWNYEIQVQQGFGQPTQQGWGWCDQTDLNIDVDLSWVDFRTRSDSEIRNRQQEQLWNDDEQKEASSTVADMYADRFMHNKTSPNQSQTSQTQRSDRDCNRTDWDTDRDSNYNQSFNNKDKQQQLQPSIKNSNWKWEWPSSPSKNSKVQFHWSNTNANRLQIPGATASPMSQVQVQPQAQHQQQQQQNVNQNFNVNLSCPSPKSVRFNFFDEVAKQNQQQRQSWSSNGAYSSSNTPAQYNNLNQNRKSRHLSSHNNKKHYKQSEHSQRSYGLSHHNSRGRQHHHNQHHNQNQWKRGIRKNKGITKHRDMNQNKSNAYTRFDIEDSDDELGIGNSLHSQLLTPNSNSNSNSGGAINIKIHSTQSSPSHQSQSNYSDYSTSTSQFSSSWYDSSDSSDLSDDDDSDFSDEDFSDNGRRGKQQMQYRKHGQSQKLKQKYGIGRWNSNSNNSNRSKVSQWLADSHKDKSEQKQNKADETFCSRFFCSCCCNSNKSKSNKLQSSEKSKNVVNKQKSKQSKTDKSSNLNSKWQKLRMTMGCLGVFLFILLQIGVVLGIMMLIDFLCAHCLYQNVVLNDADSGGSGSIPQQTQKSQQQSGKWSWFQSQNTISIVNSNPWLHSISELEILGIQRQNKKPEQVLQERKVQMGAAVILDAQIEKKIKNFENSVAEQVAPSFELQMFGGNTNSKLSKEYESLRKNEKEWRKQYEKRKRDHRDMQWIQATYGENERWLWWQINQRKYYQTDTLNTIYLHALKGALVQAARQIQNLELLLLEIQRLKFGLQNQSLYSQVFQMEDLDMEKEQQKNEAEAEQTAQQQILKRRKKNMEKLASIIEFSTWILLRLKPDPTEKRKQAESKYQQQIDLWNLEKGKPQFDFSLKTGERQNYIKVPDLSTGTSHVYNVISVPIKFKCGRPSNTGSTMQCVNYYKQEKHNAMIGGTLRTLDTWQSYQKLGGSDLANCPFECYVSMSHRAAEIFNLNFSAKPKDNGGQSKSNKTQSQQNMNQHQQYQNQIYGTSQQSPQVNQEIKNIESIQPGLSEEIFDSDEFLYELWNQVSKEKLKKKKAMEQQKQNEQLDKQSESNSKSQESGTNKNIATNVKEIKPIIISLPQSSSKGFNEEVLKQLVEAQSQYKTVLKSNTLEQEEIKIENNFSFNLDLNGGHYKQNQTLARASQHLLSMSAAVKPLRISKPNQMANQTGNNQKRNSLDECVKELLQSKNFRQQASLFMMANMVIQLNENKERDDQQADLGATMLFASMQDVAIVEDSVFDFVQGQGQDKQHSKYGEINQQIQGQSLASIANDQTQSKSKSKLFFKATFSLTLQMQSKLFSSEDPTLLKMVLPSASRIPLHLEASYRQDNRTIDIKNDKDGIIILPGNSLLRGKTKRQYTELLQQNGMGSEYMVNLRNYKSEL